MIADISAPGGRHRSSRRASSTSRRAATESLVARGLLRPGAGGTAFVFQLHPQGYKFARATLRSSSCCPPTRPTHARRTRQAPITVSNLELRLPVAEQPGGIVQPPSPPVIPPGYTPSIDNRTGGGGPSVVPIAGKAATGVVGLAKGGIRATKKRLVLRLSCKGGPCSGSLTVRRGKRKLAAGPYAIPAGETQQLRFFLTKGGRKIVARNRLAGGKKPIKAKLTFTDAGRPAPLVLKRPVRVKKPG